MNKVSEPNIFVAITPNYWVCENAVCIVLEPMNGSVYALCYYTLVAW